MKSFFATVVLGAAVFCSGSNAFAQMPGGMMGGGARGAGANQNMNVGRLYGKVIDSKTGKGLDGASVLLIGNRFDSTTKKMKEVVLNTIITPSNGNFSFEGLAVFSKFKLRITAIGYKDYLQPVGFDIKMPQGGAAAGGDGANRMAQMMSMADKDLGNIKLEVAESTLEAVTVTTTAKQLFEMGVDRKIFNVDKNLVSAGQTATEVMRQLPGVNVDIDGNVTIRNASPQIFVDGRPTTLTLDQIPADIIDKVELLTNPGAKFDASGGNAGILNVVLKKNKKVGYNGGIRAGIDSRFRLNGGGDINVRQNKINFFAAAQANQRRSLSWIDNERNNVPIGSQLQSKVTTKGDGENDGYFAFVRGGFDWFVDNRNTISVSANYNRGQFNNNQDQRIDSTISNVFSSYSNNITRVTSNFENFGSQLSYKHNFAKNGHNISADVNYNSANNDGLTNLNIDTYDPSNNPKGAPFKQRNVNSGYNRFLTTQIDYENPLTDNSKFEAGARVAVRDFRNDLDQFRFDNTLSQFVLVPRASSKYKFNDQVYAAYTSYGFKVKKWSYQLGLRVESSRYTGTLIGGARSGQDTSFRVDFPLSLFPSAFITYKATEKADIQFNYSRRVNRPNFFQLIPFPDLTDPQNISIGNVALRPEFTNSFEVNYNYAYKRGANFLVGAYFKNSENLITRYQYKGANPIVGGDSVIYNTFVNANSSYNYGIELTNRMPVVKWWDLTVNVNIYNSIINGNNIESGLRQEQVSWFAKWNNNFKLPKSYSIQLSADYQARTVLPPSGGGGGGRFGGGGMMFGGGVQTTAQGYIDPRFSFDIAIRKDWTWKGGNSASLTISMNDFLRTQLYKTFSESIFFNQFNERRRDPQVLRVNFNYRFGKFDASLFKRKNTKSEGGFDAGGMMGQ